MVIVNGKEQALEGLTLAELLAQEAYQLDRVVVELNGHIIPPDAYAKTQLLAGDQVEVVSFVGGG